MDLFRKLAYGNDPKASGKSILLRWFKIIILLYGINLAYKLIRRWFRKTNALKAIEECRIKQKAKITKQVKDVKDLLEEKKDQYPCSDVEKQILQSNAWELVDMLKNQEATSVQLVLVFLKRCIEVGVPANIVTDFNHREALLRAQHCDQHRSTLQQIPPFYGIPVSLSNNIELKGTDCSIGLRKEWNKLSCDDGLIVSILVEELGVIPFIKTWVPTAFISSQGESQVFGELINNSNQQRVFGGSACGEAAAISNSCSPLGFSTDLTDTIRTSCLFSGLHGFSISPDRCTVKGISLPPYVALEYLKCSFGVVAKSARDVETAIKTILSSERMIENDFYIHANPWRDQPLKIKPKFKVALLPQTPESFLSLGQKRVMKDAVNELAKQGHEIVSLDFDGCFTIVKLFIQLTAQLVMAKKHHYYMDVQSADVFQFKGYKDSYLSRIALNFSGADDRVANFRKLLQPIAMSEFAKLYEFHQLHCHNLYKYITDHRIDAVLVPGLSVAYLSSECGTLSRTHYGHLFPLAARMCSGAIPVGNLRADETSFTDSFQDSITESTNANLKGGVGLPLGVQVCALRNQDEQCLRIMSDLSQAFTASLN